MFSSYTVHSAEISTHQVENKYDKTDRPLKKPLFSIDSRLGLYKYINATEKNIFKMHIVVCSGVQCCVFMESIWKVNGVGPKEKIDSDFLCVYTGLFRVLYKWYFLKAEHLQRTCCILYINVVTVAVSLAREKQL